MSTLVAAYLIVWLAVVFYVLRLGAGQRRLLRDLEALELQYGEPRFGESRKPQDSVSKAA